MQPRLLENAEVFLTGSTGVVGGAVLEDLLLRTQARIHLLIRADSNEQLEERFNRVMNFMGIAADAAMSFRISLYRGDAAKPMFGLNQEMYGVLTKTITHIIHCASSVKLNMGQQEADDACFIPASCMRDFVLACARENVLKRTAYISTVGVLGRKLGILLEEPLKEPRSFHNTYESAKSKAEDLILSISDKKINTSIHRPSMVVGHSRTGKIGSFQVFYHLAHFLSGAHTAGFVPVLNNHRLDTIPSDTLAKGIIADLCEEGEGLRIFNWCTGPEASWTIEQIRAVVSPVFNKFDQRLPAPKLMDYRLFLIVLKVLIFFSSDRQRRRLQSLYAFLAYANEAQGFDNTRSKALLTRWGATVPQPASYIPRVIQFYIAHLTIPRVAKE